MNSSTFFEMLKNFVKLKKVYDEITKSIFEKFKKVDEILTKPFFEKFKKSWWPTDIHDLRIYATSRRIKSKTYLRIIAIVKCVDFPPSADMVQVYIWMCHESNLIFFILSKVNQDLQQSALTCQMRRWWMTEQNVRKTNNRIIS